MFVLYLGICKPHTKMKLKLIVPVLLFATTFASCKRDAFKTDDAGINANVTKTADLVASNSFDFATTKDLTLDVVLADKQGNPMRGVRVDVYDAPVDGITERKLFATGVTDKDGVLLVPMSVPTYIKQVTVFPQMMGVPNNVEVIITGNTVKYHYIQGKMQAMVASSSQSASGQSTVGSFSRKAGIADKYSFRKGPWNTDGLPSYLTTADTVSTAFLTRVLGALPESKSIPVYKPQYLNGSLPVVEVTQTADVWLTFIHEGASYKNSMFYYIYNKNNPPTSVNDIDSLYTIFPNTSFSGSGGALTAGDRVLLGRFGADTIIGFAMAANGFNGSSQVTAGLNVWYSHKDFNNESAVYKDHAIMLYDSITQRYIIGFEDVKRDAGSDHDFNDAVFYASANPPTGVGNPTIPPVAPTADCDGDGVPDFFDDYPCDNTKAYDRYFPSKTEYGTLAFEDLWPSKGDYDFNDLVIRMRYHAVVSPQNNVLELNCKAFVDAKGGSLPGGFGIEFPFNASVVSQVTGTQITRSRVTLASNGVEAGHTKAVMILFDECADQLSNPGGSMYNTRRFAPVALPDTINMHMTFSSNLSFTNMGTYPFNPFLFTSQRNVEVHLPNKNNTALANTALFGTSNDNTIPGSNRYYKTVNNLPWVLHFPTKFNYPAERADILTAHLKFATWVQNNGNQYGDWYEDKAGYRNSANLYTP
jgi:LruC domain-containing protein